MSTYAPPNNGLPGIGKEALIRFGKNAGNAFGSAFGSACRLSKEQCTSLEAYSNQEGFATGLEVQKWIKEKFGVCYALDGVYTLMRRLRITKKVPRPMNIKADEEIQEAYKKGV